MLALVDERMGEKEEKEEDRSEMNGLLGQRPTARWLFRDVAREES